MPASHVQPTDGSQRYSLDVPAIKKSMLIAIFRLPDVCQTENLNKRQLTFFLFFFLSIHRAQQPRRGRP